MPQSTHFQSETPQHPLIQLTEHLALHPVHEPPLPHTPHLTLHLMKPSTPSQIGDLMKIMKKEPLLDLPEGLRQLKRLQRSGKEVRILVAVTEELVEECLEVERGVVDQDEPTTAQDQETPSNVQNLPRSLPDPLQALLVQHNISITESVQYPRRMPHSSVELQHWSQKYEWREVSISYLKAQEKLDSEGLEKRTDVEHVVRWLQYVRERMGSADSTSTDPPAHRSFCVVVKTSTGEKISEAFDESPTLTAGLYYNAKEIEALRQQQSTTPPTSSKNPLHHACILCINHISNIQINKSHLGTDEYLCNGYDFYCSHEPCVMCSMALVHARVNRVFFFRNHPKGGITRRHIHENKSLNHHYKCYEVVEQ